MSGNVKKRKNVTAKNGPEWDCNNQKRISAESGDTVSMIFNHVGIDEEDEFEVASSKTYSAIVAQIGHLTPSSIPLYLLDQTSVSMKVHNEYQSALLYGILTSSDGLKLFEYMNSTARDGLSCILGRLKYLTHIKFVRLQKPVVDKIVWLVRSLIKNGISGAEHIVFNLLRQIKTGDYDAPNIEFGMHVLEMLLEHRDWLTGQDTLIPVVFYIVIKLARQHSGRAGCSRLLKTEIEIAEHLFLKKPFFCLNAIGRDVIRLIELLRVVSDAHSIVGMVDKYMSERIGLVSDVLYTPTNRKCLIAQLTPELETEIHFVMEKVSGDNFKYYTVWLSNKHFNIDDISYLIMDLVRYICCVYHPSNAILCSNVIPRWSVISWLISIVTDKNILSTLYYDWMFFSKKKDSIMNIEPGILVITGSIVRHPQLSIALLEFMKFASVSFPFPLNEDIHKNYMASISFIIEKGVIPSVDILYSCPNPVVKSLSLDLFQSQPIKKPVPSKIAGKDLSLNEDPKKDINLNGFSHFGSLIEKIAGFDENTGEDLDFLLSELKDEVVQSISQVDSLMLTKGFSDDISKIDKYGGQFIIDNIMDVYMDAINKKHRVRINRMARIIRMFHDIRTASSLVLHYISRRNFPDVFEGKNRIQIDMLGSEHGVSEGTGKALSEIYRGYLNKTDARMRFNEDVEDVLVRVQSSRITSRDDADTYVTCVVNLCALFQDLCEGNMRFLYLILYYIEPDSYIGILFALERLGIRLFTYDMLGVVRDSLTWHSNQQIFLWKLIHSETYHMKEIPSIVAMMKCLLETTDTIPCEAMDGFLSFIRSYSGMFGDDLISQLLETIENDTVQRKGYTDYFLKAASASLKKIKQNQ